MIAKIVIYCSELIMTTLVTGYLVLSRRLIDRKLLPQPLLFGHRYLFVANHASFLDPIVMWSVFSLAQRINGAPTKVMTARFVYNTALRPILWTLGAFPARGPENAPKPAGVEAALQYLDQGYNVCIFPEGKRSTRSDNHVFSGVSRILQTSTTCEVILIHIVWHSGPWWKRRLELRSQLAPSDLDRSNAAAIMNAIYDL